VSPTRKTNLYSLLGVIARYVAIAVVIVLAWARLSYSTAKQVERNTALIDVMIDDHNRMVERVDDIYEHLLGKD